MLFSSATFLFAFLPVVALLYYLIPKRCTAARNLFLTGASLLFYAWGEPRFVLVMLLVIVSSWLFARKIEASAKSARKGFLLVAVSVDLTVLFVFKYLGFFTENLNRLPFVRLPVPQITLPIGISFFTFQAISYVVDVYRGEAAQKSLWDVMLYIAFFPQLIAGPIVRYSDFADQIHNRQESLQNWNRGGYRFAIGLGKKVILSNNLAYVADAAFSSVGNLSFSMAWIGAVGYSLQLYFDFSGYSDMAIGLGQMFGFHFLENFNYPFISRSITELWRRWHISLGKLVPRLCLHSAGRQPCGCKTAALLQHFYCLAADRHLAWRQMDVHCLGHDVLRASVCGAHFEFVRAEKLAWLDLYGVLLHRGQCGVPVRECHRCA